MKFPFEWQPETVSTQLATLGDIAIACVPGEFTTMSGRRLRAALREALSLREDTDVVIAGLCNTYSDYITTPEEYQVRTGASAILPPYRPLYSVMPSKPLLIYLYIDSEIRRSIHYIRTVYVTYIHRTVQKACLVTAGKHR